MASSIAHEASGAGRVREPDRQHGNGTIRTRVDEPRQGIGGDERHVAVEHEHLVLVRDVWQRLHHGVTCAVLFGLQHPFDIGIGEAVAYRVAAVSVHDVGPIGPETRGCGEHVREQRPARERLQHLREVGFHPLALARRQDHDTQWH